MRYVEWGCDCGNKGCPECDPKKRKDKDQTTEKEQS